MTDTIDSIRHDPEVAKLIAQRRKALPDDEFIEEFDTTNDAGEKIDEKPVRGAANEPATVEANLTKMYRPAPSTTTDLQILRIEAEAADEGDPPDNPHIPATASLLEHATDVLDSEGLTPAWEVGL